MAWSPRVLPLLLAAPLVLGACGGESANRETLIVALTREGPDGESALSQDEAECVADVVYDDPELADQANRVGFVGSIAEIDQEAPGFLDALAGAVADCRG